MSSQNTEIGNVPHERLAEEVVVQQPGYAYIYFSNDNGQPLEVFFDDFTVEHVHSAIVQADDYYPFGLTFNSYRRELGKLNEYLYQGKERSEALGWDDFHARMYSPALGRFFGVDPQDQFASPFIGMGNNPIILVDPDGEFVHIVIGALVGGAINLAMNWDNIDNPWEGIAAFGVGAGAGAATAACGSCGGAMWIAAGGGAAISATNNVISQTGNGIGFKDVDWGQVGLNAGVGSVAGLAGFGAGNFASNNLASPLINSWNVQSPVLAGAINGTISGGAGGYAGGFATGLVLTGDLLTAHQYGFSGLKTGASLGGGIGAASSYISASKQGINPWTGKYESSRMGFIGDRLNWRSQMQKHGPGSGKSYFENLSDAQAVFDAFKSGQGKIIWSDPGQNRVYFKYNGVKGFNVNANIPSGIQSTNTFFIKGGINQGATVVPHNSNYSPPPVKINW